MAELSLTQVKMQEAEQMSLLPEFPELAGLAERWPEPTGKILSKDEELCDAIASRVLEGDSDRKIAKEFGVNRRSIKAVMNILEARGKLAPLKERLIAKVGAVAELSLERMREALDDDLVPPAALPIYAGVAIDKKALLEGGATVRVESVQVAEPSIEEFRARVRAHLEAEAQKRRALEVESMGQPQIGGGLAHE